MKKSLLLLGAVCIALSGTASPRKAHPRQASPKLSFERNATIKNASGKILRHNLPVKKTPAKVGYAEDIITSAEGTRQKMAVTCSGYDVYFDSVFEFENESYASHVVYGEGDEVYIYNVIPQMPTDSYVKGKKEGDKIIVDLPQTVLWDDEHAEGANVTVCDYYEIEEDGEVYFDFAMAEDQTLVFAVAEDGIWNAEGLDPKHIVALTYCTDDYWTGYGAWKLSIKPFNQTLVSLPDGYEVSENLWKYKCGSLGYGWDINFARGEDIYIQGLSEVMPEAWVKATVESGDSEAHVFIDQNQYVGIYEGSFVVTKCARYLVGEDGYAYYELMPEDYRLELIWDNEEGKMVVNDPSVSLLLNRSMDEVYFADELYEFELLKQTSYEGTPADPYDLIFYDWMEDYDYSVLECRIPALSTDGYLLDTDDLSYIIYLDDDPFTFTPEEYDLEESMVEIPWSFDNEYDILKTLFSCRHAVYLYVEGISTIGVQSVYKYGGKETRSGIVTLNLDGDSVGGINSDKKVVDVRCFDIAGREVSNHASGIVIERVAFDDGSVASFKKVAR